MVSTDASTRIRDEYFHGHLAELFVNLDNSLSSPNVAGSNSLSISSIIIELWKYRDIIEERYPDSGAIITADEELPHKLSPQKKLEWIDDYVCSRGGPPVAHHIVALFPAIAAQPRSHSANLPATAPARWRDDKTPGDTPAEFIKRHYKRWLGKGLSRPDIKRLDPPLYVALANWLRTNELPADLPLPTLKEKNDQLAEELKAGERPAFGTLSAREAGRLAGLLQRRRSDPSQHR